MNRELKPKHVTLQVPLDEYIEVQPDGWASARYAAWQISRKGGLVEAIRYALSR